MLYNVVHLRRPSAYREPLMPGTIWVANVATDSVSGCVWEGMTSCPAHRALPHAIALYANALLCNVGGPDCSEADRTSAPKTPSSVTAQYKKIMHQLYVENVCLVHPVDFLKS